MTHAPVDAWLVAALASADRVLLLGPGWDTVAGALAHQGVDVAVDTVGEAGPPAGVGLVAAGNAGGEYPVVGVALEGRDSLHDALAVRPERVVTCLDLSRPVDLGRLAGSWPLAVRSETTIDDTWAAIWDVTTEPGPDLAHRLVTALHTTALALRSLADTAVTARESSARSAAVATRRQAAAEARARATATLADRWAASQDALVESLTRQVEEQQTRGNGRSLLPPPSNGGGRGGLLSRFGRGSAGAAPSELSTVEAARHPVAAGWRVAVVEGAAADWLGGWVDATVLPVDELPVDDLVEHVGGHLDVLVIGRVEVTRRAAVAALVHRARDAGVAVVGIADAGMPWPRFQDLCDVLVTDVPQQDGPRTLAAAHPVDPTEVNPTVGFRWSGGGLVTVMTTADADRAAVRADLAAMGVAEVDLVGAGTDVALHRTAAARVRQLGRQRGVVDVPAAHADAAVHARTLVELAAAGVPVLAPTLPDEVRALLGPVLADTLTAARVEDLDDPNTRELLSARQRRAALWTHTHEARWRRVGRALDLPVPSRPSVSAVVVTNRPTHLEHCATQLARQTYRPLEVVLGLHGPRFGPADVEAFVERTGLPVTGLALEGHRTLGEGLTIACQAASGSIVTKWDDDDHYGPDHLVDLVQALDYSGATIVGKGAEFVHLGQLDITIRRFVGRAESGSRSLAGGTLALRKDALAEVGWWRRIPRSVDQRLLDDVLRVGGRIHRTHGFGFVLERRAEGHTWSVDVDYFLAQSEAQWRGLARAAAGLDDSVLTRSPAPVAPPVVGSSPAAGSSPVVGSSPVGHPDRA